MPAHIDWRKIRRPVSPTKFMSNLCAKISKRYSLFAKFARQKKSHPVHEKKT